MRADPRATRRVGDVGPARGAHGRRFSPGHGAALANLDAVRVAVNRVYGDLATPITNHDEVAFFPPVTGG